MSLNQTIDLITWLVMWTTVVVTIPLCLRDRKLDWTMWASYAVYIIVMAFLTNWFLKWVLDYTNIS